ncbi:MAG: hypothetical protein H0X66_15770 [Verrucomicrobia bacterium]|nr:hypothetical protein [Verrucomicrobiota bacterium]
MDIQKYFSPVLMKMDVNASSAVVYRDKNNLPEKIAPTLGDGVAVRGCLVRLTGNGVERATKTEL